jgi:hypothetical protein
VGCSWNGSEGIVTSYSLDFPEFESQQRRRFASVYKSLQTGSGVTGPPIQSVTLFFHGEEMAGV